MPDRSPSSFNIHGPLTVKKLAAMLLEDAEMVVSRPDSWEGAKDLGTSETQESTVSAKLRDINRGAQCGIYEIPPELDMPLFQEDGHHGSY